MMSFRIKTITGIAVIEGVFLAAILINSMTALAHSNEAALHQRAASDAALFATAAANALVSEDVASLASIVRQVGHNRDVVYASAADGRGQILSQAGMLPTRGAAVVWAASRIAIGTTRYGTVQVAVSARDLAPVLRHARRRIALIAAAEMLIVGLFSWLFGTYLTRELAALKGGAARIAAGEFGYQLPLRSHDELGAAVQAFNIMSVRLRELQESGRKQQAEVVALNRELEARVQERTTELASANRELEYLAMHDPLTALPNRILLQDRLLQAIRSGRREIIPFALMIMDLDGFKDVNDTLGHHAGDLLLQETAQRLTHVLRQSDTAARLGGDEFAFLLPTISAPEHAEALARKLLQAIEQPVALGSQTIRVSASIGAVLFPAHGDDMGDLMRRADAAMYEAKHQRAGFLLFETRLEGEGDERLRLQGDLGRAISAGELVLHYQPKVDLATGRMAGAEALVRWQHPTLGLLPPVRFVPLAERTRLIKPLTLEVLRQAARQARIWHDAGVPLPIAVNVSAINLDDVDFVEQVGQTLKEAGTPPGLIELEVTETALMRDPERARLCIQHLNALGVRMSIDDFGTGYSSMAYLRKLAVAKIKIDKSFVLDMGVNRNDSVIVRSIIDLGHSLGLKVVAEGVENAESLSTLTSLGCDFAQGYHLARPLAVSAFDAWRQGHENPPATGPGDT